MNAELPPNILFNSINDNYSIFLKKLFNYSSLINHKNHIGETLLHHICFYGIIDKYYALIHMGAIIDNTIMKNNLLHYASISGRDNFLIVELVKLNILPNDKNNNGQSSLHFSANKQIANYLDLWCNRNKISIFDLIDNDGNYVIHTAKKLGHFDTISYWQQQYPQLNNVTNNNNETWQDIKTDLNINNITGVQNL
jgi:ankyrin repeat protein